MNDHSSSTATSTFVSAVQSAPKTGPAQAPEIPPTWDITNQRETIKAGDRALCAHWLAWWKSMPGKVALYTKTPREARKNILPDLNRQDPLLEEEFFAKTGGKLFSRSKFLTFRWKTGIFPQMANLLEFVRFVPDRFR